MIWEVKNRLRDGHFSGVFRHEINVKMSFVSRIKLDENQGPKKSTRKLLQLIFLSFRYQKGPKSWVIDRL